MNLLEEGTELALDFGKLQAIGRGEAAVIPVAVQDADSKEVLIVAYANQEALSYTLMHGVAAFWSTSRNELWVKGATSGDTLELVEARVNCEQNSLLYLVRPLGRGRLPHQRRRRHCTRRLLLSSYRAQLPAGRARGRSAGVKLAVGPC